MSEYEAKKLTFPAADPNAETVTFSPSDMRDATTFTPIGGVVYWAVRPDCELEDVWDNDLEETFQRCTIHEHSQYVDFDGEQARKEG